MRTSCSGAKILKTCLGAYRSLFKSGKSNAARNFSIQNGAYVARSQNHSKSVKSFRLKTKNREIWESRVRRRFRESRVNRQKPGNLECGCLRRPYAAWLGSAHQRVGPDRVLLQQDCCDSTVATVLLQQYCCNSTVATVLLQQYCCNLSLIHI